MSIKRQPARFSARAFVSAGALVLGVRLLPADASAAAAAMLRHHASRSLHPASELLSLASIPTARSTSLLTARRWAPASAPRSRWWSADELDADWKRVKIEQAHRRSTLRRAKHRRLASPSAISIDVMRTGGRHRASDADSGCGAAMECSAVDECETDLHDIGASPDRPKLGYGELAAAASKLPVPKKADVQLKPKSRWRYIGKGHAELRSCQDLCTGKAVYGMDARMDGMVYAAIEHPPVLGGKVKSL